jgi:hypothetical protein
MPTKFFLRFVRLCFCSLFASASLAHATIDVNGILTIEGAITLTNNSGVETGGAEGINVFIGDGLYQLPDESVNPVAHGLIIQNATVGVVKIGSNYAVVATGTGQTVGIPGTTLTGDFSVRVNTLGSAVSETIHVQGTGDTIDVIFAANEGNLSEINSVGAAIDIGGQSISADIANSGKRTIVRSGSPETGVELGIVNGSTAYKKGGTDLLTMQNALGNILLMSDGAAASLVGDLTFGVLAASGGSAQLQINTSTEAVDEIFSVDAGPLNKIEIPYLAFSLGGLDIFADCAFQQIAGGSVVAEAFNLATTFDDGSTDLLSLTDGSGHLLLTSAGTALNVESSITFADSDVSALGNFALQINDTVTGVDETFNIGGSSINFLLPAGPYLQITGTTVQLAILDATLTGDFTFEPTVSGNVKGTVANTSMAFNDGSTDLMTIANGNGALFMDSLGTGITFTGDTNFNDPNLSVAAPLTTRINSRSVAINETFSLNGNSVAIDLTAGPYVEIGDTAITFSIDGETLQANLAFRKLGSDKVYAAVAGGSYAQGTDLVEFIDASGFLFLFEDGLAGQLNGIASINIPGITTSSGFDLLINTTDQSIDLSLVIDFTNVNLSLPSGSFIRVVATGAEIVTSGLSLLGDFSFESSSPDPVALSAASVAYNMGPGVLIATDGTGTLDINSSGAAGALTFNSNSFSTTSVSLIGSPGATEINTRLAQPSIQVPFAGASAMFNHLEIAGSSASFSGDILVDQFNGMARLRITNTDTFGSGTRLSLETGTGDLQLTDGNLVSILPAVSIDYGLNLDQPLLITGGTFAVTGSIPLRIHPAALKTGVVPLIDFTSASSTVTAGDFSINPALPTGFSHIISSQQLLLNSAVKPDSDDDGLSDAWEDTYTVGTDTTSLAPTDNSDGDRLPAIAEFALGLDPTISDTPDFLLTFTDLFGQEYFSISYPRNPDAIGLVGILTERSIDLGSTDPWSTDDTTYQSSTETEATDRSTVPRSIGSKEFLRLQFLRP